MEKQKYHKNHPLWPVYDFQHQILLRGGIIDRRCDLLSLFEKRSLEPDSEPFILFRNITTINRNIDTDGLFLSTPIYYSKFLDGWTIERNFTKYDEILSGHKKTLDKEADRLYTTLKDNEFIAKLNPDFIIKIDEKYLDILRLVRNGYDAPVVKVNKIDKNVFIAIIIGVSLIIATFIYACSTRFIVQHHSGSSPIRMDKWTGEYQKMKRIE